MLPPPRKLVLSLNANNDGNNNNQATNNFHACWIYSGYINNKLKSQINGICYRISAWKANLTVSSKLYIKTV